MTTSSSSPFDFVTTTVEAAWEKFWLWLHASDCCLCQHDDENGNGENQRDLLFQLMRIPKDCDTNMCLHDPVEPAASFDSDEDTLFLSDIIVIQSSQSTSGNLPNNNNNGPLES